MAKVREYQFVTGIETSTIPNPGTPSAANDSITLGYLEDKSYWGAAVASYAALRALASTARKDRQARLVDVSTGEIWVYDSASTGTDDGATILKPDDLALIDPGRWVKQTSAGGGGGGGGSGVEQLLQKLEMEKASIFTESLDNSLGISGAQIESSLSYTGYLTRDFTSGGTTMYIAWSPVVANDSDQNYDSATGWVAALAGASVGTTSTAGQFTIGTAAISFDKNASNVLAEVGYDRGSANLNVTSNTRVWCWVYLPSITGLTGVYVRLSKSAGNSAYWRVTTQFDGSAFAVGLNLVVFDITATATATVGTGTLYTDLIRTVSFGVETNVAGQTYTGVAFDALYFSVDKPERIGFKGNEFTIFNTSTTDDVKIAAANTRHDGALTLVSAVSNNYSGGLSGAAKSTLKRFLMSNVGDGLVYFDSSLSSGEASVSQEYRISRTLRESITGNMTAVLDVYPSQVYEVTTVGVSTIGVSDSNNDSANLVNGDSVDVFETVYENNKRSFIVRSTKTLTAGSSHLSGTTTLTLDVTGIQVGDYIAKRLVTSTQLSGVGKATNETFGTLSLESNPTGIQLIGDGINYPQESALFAHYFLGAGNITDAIRLRKGSAASRTLRTVGTPGSVTNAFQRDRRSLAGSGSGNYYDMNDGSDASQTDGNAEMIQISFWFYFDAVNASPREMLSQAGTTNGWFAEIQPSAQNVTFYINTTNVGTSPTITIGWHHMFLVINSSGNSRYYLDGALVASISSVPTSSGYNLQVLNRSSGSVGANGLRLADLLIWRNGTEFSAGLVRSLYNSGTFLPVGFDSLRARYQYAESSVSGQKISLKTTITRTTTAVNPVIWKMGAIQTS